MQQIGRITPRSTQGKCVSPSYGNLGCGGRHDISRPSNRFDSRSLTQKKYRRPVCEAHRSRARPTVRQCGRVIRLRSGYDAAYTKWVMPPPFRVCSVLYQQLNNGR
jgi:hypothetical protein